MTDERTVDGVQPQRWVRPENDAELADVLRAAEASGEWVALVGGSTAQAATNPVERIPIGCDITAMTGIREYQPTDLTVSVAAGTRWSELQATLRENGQAVPVDVPYPDVATVGGVVATGYAGPRRLRDGTLKDLLLGASFVRGDGLTAKAGGMVVKNVSGFEIPRLLHGSWGSLAVITSVNLKVIPRHEFELTLTAAELDTTEAAERVLNLTRARSAIAAAVIDGNLESARSSVRLTGRDQPTRELAGEVTASAGLPWDASPIDGDASESWWQQREDRLAGASGERVSLQVGCQPSDTVQTLRTLRQALPDVSAFDVHASPGTGAINLEFDASACSLDTWAHVWSEHGLDAVARFVVNSAPRVWRAERDVWFIPYSQRKIMTALKRAFDPNDTINRGRLWTTALVTQP